MHERAFQNVLSSLLQQSTTQAAEPATWATSTQSSLMLDNTANPRIIAQFMNEFTLLTQAAILKMASYVSPIHDSWRTTMVRNPPLATATLIVTTALFAINHTALAQGLKNTSGLPSIIEETKNPEWSTRAEAFHALLALLNQASEPSQVRGTIIGAIISLLVEESKHVNTHDGLPEAYTEYYGELIGSVANLRDPRAISILITPNILSAGNIATDGLSAFGDDAVDDILTQLDSKSVSDNAKVALVRALLAMLRDGKLHEAQNKQLTEEALLEAVKAGAPFVRLNSVRGLAYFGDQRAQQAIKDAATSDDYVVGEGETAVYPVRIEARRLLAAPKP